MCCVRVGARQAEDWRAPIVVSADLTQKQSRRPRRRTNNGCRMVCGVTSWPRPAVSCRFLQPARAVPSSPGPSAVLSGRAIFRRCQRSRHEAMQWAAHLLLTRQCSSKIGAQQRTSLTVHLHAPGTSLPTWFIGWLPEPTCPASRVQPTHHVHIVRQAITNACHARGPQGAS